MLKWISKLWEGSSLEVPEGVPVAWVQRLDTYLASVEKAAAGKLRGEFTRDILDYVLRGDPQTVLQEAGRSQELGMRLGLLGYHYGPSEGENSVYQDFHAVPVPIALRWAKLLGASLGNFPIQKRFQMGKSVLWPEALLLHSVGHSVQGWSSSAPSMQLSLPHIEAMLAEDGMDPAALLVASFATPVTSTYRVGHYLQMVSQLGGYADSLGRYVESVRPLTRASDVAQRVHILQMLLPANVAALQLLAAEMADAGVATSKQVRAAAEPLIRKAGTAVHAPLREIALKAKPEQRMRALRLLASMAEQGGDVELARFARETATADKAPSVQTLIGEWDQLNSGASIDEASYQYTVPEIDWSGATNKPSAETLAELWSKVEEMTAKANSNSRAHHASMQAQGRNFPLHLVELPTDTEKAALSLYLASDTPVLREKVSRKARGMHLAAVPLHDLAAEGRITPAALFKMLHFFGYLVKEDGSLNFQAMRGFDAIYRRTGRPTLLELAQMMSDVGLAGASLLNSYCHWGGGFARHWADEAVWPYFAHHLDSLLDAVTRAASLEYWFERKWLFRALGSLPSLPPTAVNALLAVALGTAKSDRLEAQKALEAVPGKEARIIAALADGKAETRIVAAQWLARLRHAPAVPHLAATVVKEKHDTAKGALLDALQALGEPVEKYLNRDSLEAEAKKSLAKGVPKDLEWFPWSAMPEVRWADTEKEISRDVLRWFLIQAVKQKLPEPNAVLRKYCAMFEPRDRERLGQFVLENWLQEDIHPIAVEEANKRAVAQAQMTHQSMAQYPQYYKDSPHLGKSVEQLTATCLPTFLKLPAGSAVSTKGLLAVVAACAAERAAAPVQRYLKDWYGSRAAQGKALIAMLAWIEHPSATQLMLSIGNRFRTKSFQEEATRQAEALAERKGWTLAELADRTIPAAGFDETGVLELSYGERLFTARLLPSFKIDLFNPDGKKITALPEPRQDDDAERAKDAKKALSSARKEIKAIVDLQTDRLYEALCTGRDWSYSDWNDYLFRHPVVRHLVQRLVWARSVNGKAIGTFRPLDDGTLTDVGDEAVVPASDERIRIAHDSLLPASEVESWQQHMPDYEITPLFQQLGKGTYALPSERNSDLEIKDFEGYLLEAFALRGRALKLGYTRGPAEDGGWFHRYEKRFPTLGMNAEIEFTGNGLPEENRTVALMNLSFSGAAAAGDSWNRPKLALGEIPKVLLSECYNDLRLIASEGSGFDPDWQKKSGY